MIDSGDEIALGGFEGIISGEMYVQEEDTSSIWTVILFKLREIFGFFDTGPIIVACQWN